MPGLVPYVMIMLLVYITVKTTIHGGSRESICSTVFVTFPICLCHRGQKNLVVFGKCSFGFLCQTADGWAPWFCGICCCQKLKTKTAVVWNKSEWWNLDMADFEFSHNVAEYLTVSSVGEIKGALGMKSATQPVSCLSNDWGNLFILGSAKLQTGSTACETWGRLTDKRV